MSIYTSQTEAQAAADERYRGVPDDTDQGPLVQRLIPLYGPN